MAKKSKQANLKKDNEKLTINKISVGITIPDSTKNQQDWEITDDLIEQMRRYEKKSNKSAIWRNKITGNFLYFKYVEERPEFLEAKANAKEKRAETLKNGREKKNNAKIEKLEEQEVEDEENELLDCIEDYKTEYGVKNVNINSKKFKTFYTEWREFGY